MFGSGPILVFHQTVDRFYPGINNIKPRNFFAIIGLIGDLNFSFSPIKKNQPDQSAKVVTLTFDDGYAANYDILLQLIDRNIAPVVFIPTAFIGKTNAWEYSSDFFPASHLSRSQISDLANRGVVFGSHGHSHRPLERLSREEIRRELTISRQMLEEIIRRPVKYMSFPFGRTNPAVNETAAECGYIYGLGMPSTPAALDDSDFIIRRIPLYASDTYFSVRRKLCGPTWVERMQIDIISRLAGGTIITGRRFRSGP